MGSPGRLRDHVKRGSLDMVALGCVVLDEADDLLDMGFREDVEFLLRAAGPARQTLMFSATVSGRIEELAARFQTGAARVDAAPGAGASASIRFEAMAVALSDRENAIVNVLRHHQARGAIVFCGTREGVAHLASRLGDRGFNVVTLSGGLPQRARNAALAAMRDGRARVCVATDLAARGVDLPGLELVVHADLPANEVAMTHRSGRTGRAGRKGLAVFVVPHPQRRRAEALAGRAGIELHWVPAPGPEAIFARDETRVLADTALGEEVPPEERAALRLLDRHGAERVAFAYLRGAARSRPAPKPLIGSTGDFARMARRRIENGVWFGLACGRAGKAEARWLLPLICRLGHVTKKDVGRIVIGERETRFEISARAAERFAAAVARPGEAGVSIRRTAAPDAGGPRAGGAAEPPEAP